MQPDVAKRLLDAQVACAAIERFVAGIGFEEFSQSALIRSAVERQFEIVGEALGRATKVDAALADRIPDVPRIVGLRNRLIHGYDSVDDQIVWDIVCTKLPDLRRSLMTELTSAGYLPPDV